jgi:ATP-dependent Clp protease, protease subunit
MVGRVTFSSLLLVIALVSTCVLAQEAPVPPIQGPKSVVINFFVQVDANTVNQLVQVIDNQIRAGAKKVTILISSAGGETTSAFTAYNFIRGLPVEVTTFNVGNVDSAATVIYCAGKKRYSLPGTRFILHGASVGFGGNTLLNMQGLESQLALLKNQNQMISHVIAANTNKKESDIDAVLRTETILNPDDAKSWGLVQEIRTEFLEPGAMLVTVNNPPLPVVKPSFEFKTLPIMPTTTRGPVSGAIVPIQ